jgi:hypothetical protein
MATVQNTYDISGVIVDTSAEGIRCKYTDSDGDDAYDYISWRLMYPNCARLNANCNPSSGAYVPAVTVCNQNLF